MELRSVVLPSRSQSLRRQEEVSLYANINRRKKSGTSRSKSKSTITDKAYANMKAGFPKKKKSLLKR